MAAITKTVLKKNKKLALNGRIWMECNGERFFGPGPLELLEHIYETGSISKAAKQMDMSYKKAWEIINTLNGNAAQPFVITQAGGARGGGSFISDDAKEMIRYYRLLRERFQSFLTKESAKIIS